MNNLTIARIPDAALKYHHLEASLTHGIQFTASYQWASSSIKDFQPNEFSADRVWRPNPNYHPQSFRMYGVFELPFGHGRPCLHEGFFSKLVGGWQVAPIYHLQWGRALDFRNQIFFGDTHNIALPRDKRTINRWFNWQLFPRAQRDYSAANPQPYRDRIRQIVPQSFMDTIGKTYDNVVPTDFNLDSFHARIFPSRFNYVRGD